MISFEFKNDRLSIIYKGEVRCYFEKGHRALTVGKGKNYFRMFHGSFQIYERTMKKKELFIKKIEVEEGNKAKLFLNEGTILIELKNNYAMFFPEGLQTYNRMWMEIPSTKNEKLYGGGEIFTELNLKGKKLNVWVAEHINVLQTVRKIAKMAFGSKNTTRKQAFKTYETYYAQPTFISSNKYFFHSLETARAVFDFTRDKKIVIKIDEVKPYVYGFASNYEELISELTNILGRQPELPDWVYDGQILGIQGGTDVMMKKYQKVKEKDGKVNGIWIQDWEGRRVTAVGKQLYWNWEWDQKLYPGLDEKIKELNAEGVKVLGYCNPFLAVEKPLYKEASAKGYCVHDKDGKDYYVKITTFPAAMVDLTNPEAYEWLKNIIKKNMIGLGFSGWMADFAEYLPTDAVLYSGEDAEFVHNSWPQRWAKLNREAIEETGNLGKIMFFTRSGSSGSPKYTTMMWNGDNHPDFSIDFGLPSVIPAMLSLTCSGMGLSHSDIGGYTTIMKLHRDQEVYYRWFEMNAFSLLMRGHEGLNPDLNIQFDDNNEILEHCAKMGRIHATLKPYLKEAVKYNSTTGVGVIRPLFFYYEEEEAYNECYEYLLGRDILVCPVIKHGARRMKVYLPKDEWVHIYTGKVYQGGNHFVDCPIGQTPVFIRKDKQNELLENLKKVI